METTVGVAPQQVPWNKGRLIGQRPPLRLRDIWAIRIRLQLTGRTRELALFNLAIDSKLRGCDLVALRVCDVAQGGSSPASDHGPTAQDPAPSPIRAHGADT